MIKNHMIIAIDTEIQHPFMIKMLNKVGIEANFFNL